MHISNIHRREEFRKENMIAPVCSSSVVGFGPFGYHLAMIGIMQVITEVKGMQAQQAEVTAQA